MKPRLLLLLALAFAPSAWASHYRLSATGLTDDAETKALAAQELHTTVQLLERTAAVKDRRALGQASGVSFARLTELATQCDLLRVNGVGPSVVRLLQAAGVHHVLQLKAAKADALHAKLEATNQAHKIMDVLPPKELLQSWIDQAQRLPKKLEGVK
jgi:predicted flap endonuclease-1-like 5' DNA nuclease